MKLEAVIKTIIFDLGRTLIPFDYKRGYDRLSRICPYPAEEIPKRIGSTGLVNRFESGAVEPRAFVNELSGVLGIAPDYDQFCDIWSSIFLPETLISEELLQGLRRNHRLLLLSNTNAIHFEMIWNAYPLLRHFDAHVLSYRVGAMKPSPVIYQEAIRQAQCLPQECFFTDDVASYIDAAREQGIDAVQFQNSAQIEQELRHRGVTW